MTQIGSGVKMQSQQIQDEVFFHENLIYSKVYRTIFRQISQKLGIPWGGGGGVAKSTLHENG